MNHQIPSTTVLLVALLGSACAAQQSNISKSIACRESALLSGRQSRYRAIRVFDDPSTHRRWMLLQDMTHPAAPAMLASAWGSDGAARSDETYDLRVTTCVPSAAIPVIHAGDAVLIIEHSSVADAELEAIALGRAAVGEPLKVRLKSGGHILSVIADGPGHATLYAGSEARP